MSTAHWLVLAYLAADNDLEGELLKDLAEMERVRSRPPLRPARRERP